MGFLSIFGVVIVAAFIAGASSGILGVFVIGMKMPFLAICTAHSALAGAVIAELLGLPASPGAFVGACLGALVLSILLHRRNGDMNAALGILFSLTIGLAFLGIGLSSGAKTGMFSLLWGSILFVSWEHVITMLEILVILSVFIIIFGKQLKLMLFSRELSGLVMHEGWLLAVLLLLASAIIAVNMEIIGGLLVFSLLSNPAIAALRLSRSFGAALFLSAIFGIISSLGGFFAAYSFDLPVGACIVLTSCLVVILAMIIPTLKTRFCR
jgi:manganese/iron transport system permease protein